MSKKQERRMPLTEKIITEYGIHDVGAWVPDPDGDGVDRALLRSPFIGGLLDGMTKQLIGKKVVTKMLHTLGVNNDSKGFTCARRRWKEARELFAAPSTSG